MNKQRLDLQLLDLSGAPITDATVAVQSRETGESQLAEFDSPQELYFFSDLEPGAYQVEMSREGFVSQSVRVQVDLKPVRVTIVLAKEGDLQIPRGPGLVPFVPNPETSEIIGGVAAESLTPLFQRLKLRPLTAQEPPNALTENYFFVQRSTPEGNEDLRELREDPGVQIAGLAARAEGGLRILTNQIFVRFFPQATVTEIQRLLEEKRLTLVRKVETSPSLFLVAAPTSTGLEIIKIAQRLQESPLVDSAEPHIVDPPAQDGLSPNPFLWAGAWDRHRSRVELAWHRLQERGIHIAQGSPGVVLALIDRFPGAGDIPDHPDFCGTLSDGKPKVLRIFDFDRLDSTIRAAGSHGISCAGVATGLALGAAPNCRLLAAAPPTGDQLRQSEMMRWIAGSSQRPFPEGFPPPLDRGADIVSMSVSLSTGAGLSTTENGSYAYLTRRGRRGKGCLIFVSAGNHRRNIAVSRPAGTSEFVFCCAATTLQEDGSESQAQYSNFGQLKGCAPSGSMPEPNHPHRPPHQYSVWTATLPNEADLPSAPWTTRRLAGCIKAAGEGENQSSISVDDLDGLLPNMHLLLERPGHAHAEAVEVRASRQGALLVEPLTYDHCAGTEVVLGLRPVGQLSGGAEAASSDQIQVEALASSSGLALATGTRLTLWNGSELLDPETTEVASVTLEGTVTLTSGLARVHPVGTKVYIPHQEFTCGFTGTSSSTALCAGIAALVLSANPDLTWVEAREILQSTAVKVDRMDPGWLDEQKRPASLGGAPFFNEKYGYGRLDAAAAVDAALSYRFPRDLMIRSSLSDTGDVPLSEPRDSPDIWVRDQNPRFDPEARPESLAVPGPDRPIRFGQDHWICARVTNRGSEPSLDAWVLFYIASGEKPVYEFPKDWEDSNGRGNLTSEAWEEGTYFIGEVAITGVPPGESLVVWLLWPAGLLPPRTTPKGQPWLPTLLVEITPHDGPLRGTRPGNNNNLAQKRIEILGEPPT